MRDEQIIRIKQNIHQIEKNLIVETDPVERMNLNKNLQHYEKRLKELNQKNSIKSQRIRRHHAATIEQIRFADQDSHEVRTKKITVKEVEANIEILKGKIHLLKDKLENKISINQGNGKEYEDLFEEYESCKARLEIWEKKCKQLEGNKKRRKKCGENKKNKGKSTEENQIDLIVKEVPSYEGGLSSSSQILDSLPQIPSLGLNKNKMLSPQIPPLNHMNHTSFFVPSSSSSSSSFSFIRPLPLDEADEDNISLVPLSIFTPSNDSVFEEEYRAVMKEWNLN